MVAETLRKYTAIGVSLQVDYSGAVRCAYFDDPVDNGFYYGSPGAALGEQVQAYRLDHGC